MTINFSNINLEVIDTAVNASPDIFVNSAGITFSRRVLEDLNYPQNVQYCYNTEQHIFAIRPCKANESKGTPFSKPRGEQLLSLVCKNKNIRDIVMALIPNYATSKRYKVSGFYDAESRTMYYDRNEAEETAITSRGRKAK